MVPNLFHVEAESSPGLAHTRHAQIGASLTTLTRPEDPSQAARRAERKRHTKVGPSAALALLLFLDSRLRVALPVTSAHVSPCDRRAIPTTAGGTLPWHAFHLLQITTTHAASAAHRAGPSILGIICFRSIVVSCSQFLWVARIVPLIPIQGKSTRKDIRDFVVA